MGELVYHYSIAESANHAVDLRVRLGPTVESENDLVGVATPVSPRTGRSVSAKRHTIALFSICRIRSRVSPRMRPTSGDEQWSSRAAPQGIARARRETQTPPGSVARAENHNGPSRAPLPASWTVISPVLCRPERPNPVFSA
jgi:hypothetical protein